MHTQDPEGCDTVNAVLDCCTGCEDILQLTSIVAGHLRPCVGKCRVYLMGGASSTGTGKDTVVVYTPALLDEGIYIANLTVPEGLFWSDIINPPGPPAFQVCLSQVV